MKSKHTIERTYLIGIIICVLFLVGSVFFVGWMSKQNERENINYLSDVANQSKNSIVNQINGNIQILEGLSTCLGELGFEDNGFLTSVIKKINDENDFIQMGYFNAEGIGTLLDINGSTYSNVDFSGQSFFQQALNGQRVISNTFQNSYGDGWVNYYAVPVTYQNEIVGVLCAVNQSAMLRKLMDVSVFNGNGFSHLINSEGHYIIRSSHPFANKNAKDLSGLGTIDDKQLETLYFNLSTGRSGYFDYIKNGKDMWASYQPIGINGWYIITSVPKAAINQTYQQTGVGVSIIIGAAFVIFLFFVYNQFRITNKSKRALEHVAYTDRLTGHRNFEKFLLDAAELLNQAEHKHYALLYYDLKRFKYLNDLFGYDTGDSVLLYWADLLNRDIREDELFGRVSADNFVSLQTYRDQDELFHRFQKIAVGLNQHEVVSNHGYSIDLYAGIYCIQASDFTLSVNDMLDRANMAQKSIKHLGGSHCTFYSDEMRQQVIRETELCTRIDKAFEEHEFELYLQPKVDIQHGDQIWGAEALARWNSQEKGMISPGDFIPLFEKNGYIIQLDRYMFETACQTVRKSIDEGKKPLQMAVNVSRLGLFQHDFLDFYTQIKQKYEIPDGLLELEFTESIVLDNAERFEEMVLKLKNNGFQCSLDDFGAGYSSLNILKNLPMDVLKLDMLFFRESSNIQRSRTVIAHIIAMAKELNMKIVAEGVEYMDQVDYLRQVDCDVVQGYVFARPMPVEQFKELTQNTFDIASKN